MTSPAVVTSDVASSLGFDGAFMRKLERLALLNRRPLAGPSAGPRRSPRQGASVEFADFRDYSVGDDFRRIDWNAFARLDRLFLRLYRAEEMTTLSLFIDHSASMGFGEPPKLLAAARLAAVFAYIALHGYDRVSVAGWGATIDRFLPAQSGKSVVPRVWRFIVDLMHSPAAATDFAALRGYESHSRGPGMAIVLSDFMSDTDWRASIRALRSGGKDVTVIQILAPDELHPDLRGDWKLRDSETGDEVEVTISPRLLRRYAEELALHTAEIHDFCRREGVNFLQVSSEASLTGSLLKSLQSAGVMR